MTKKQRIVNIEYAAVQGFYWMGFCVSFSYAAVFLQYNGYSNSELGLVMAMGNIFGFILSPALAALLDRSQRIGVFHCLWVLLGIQALLIIVFVLIPGRSFVLSLCYCLYMAGTIAVNPLNTQLSFELEQYSGHINYGAARGTGSIAFAPMSVLLGQLAARYSPELLPAAGLMCTGAQAGLLLALNIQFGKRCAKLSPSAAQSNTHSSSLVTFISGNKRFCLLMLGVAMLYFSHNLVNNYMINVVRNVGGDTASMGNLNAFMAIMEIHMFLYDRLTRKVSCSATLRFAAVVFAVKALAIASASGMTGLYAAHVLQALSFAVITPALVRYVNLYINHRDSAKGQAIAYAMTTLGSIFSSSLGGLMFDSFSVGMTLLIGSAVSVLGAAVCIAFTERAK